METRLAWNQALAISEVLTTSTGLLNLYGAGLMGVQQGGQWYYPLADALGSVRQGANASGILAGSASTGSE